MKLYGEKISSYWELDEYKKGAKKIIVSAECPVTIGDGIVLFNRAKKVGCVVEVTKVKRSLAGDFFYIYVKVLNSEDQDISIEYFGYLGITLLRFIGYSALCPKLKINKK